MTKIAYTSKRFIPSHLQVIERADALCEQYRRDGYSLTLRQLYYQFVQRGWLANTQQNYNRLGGIISDARLCGMLSWTAIEDRGRNIQGDLDGIEPLSMEDLFREAATGYYEDLWAEQPRRIEVWVEKESLIDIVARAARGLRVTHFACKGYVSQSEMWRAGRRLARYARGGRDPLILHLGDHDPSGIDMTRDIIDRVTLFAGRPVEVKRIALNMDQIRTYNPPPNPAKVTDSRYAGYVRDYGFESWELDSLDPPDMVTLIEQEIQRYMNVEQWEASVQAEQEERDRLVEISASVADRWPEIEQWLTDNPA